jgi:DNA replication protein DnaC
MEQLIKDLKELKLNGMADCLIQQQSSLLNNNLSFEERLELIVHQELTLKRNRKINRLLKMANLKHGISLENMKWSDKSGLKRPQLLNLMKLDCITHKQNVLITGATGCGKTHLACAIGNKACIEGYMVKFVKLPLFLEELQLHHKTGTFVKLLQSLMKYDLLILDDFGITTIDAAQLHDLFNIIDERYKLKSTIITSQLPVKSWHSYLGDPTIADALLDRFLSQATRIELQGESLRWEKPQKNQNIEEGGNNDKL